MQPLASFQAIQAAEAKRSALAWLASRLRWEHKLAELRAARRETRTARAGRAA